MHFNVSSIYAVRRLLEFFFFFFFLQNDLVPFNSISIGEFRSLSLIFFLAFSRRVDRGFHEDLVGWTNT